MQIYTNQKSIKKKNENEENIQNQRIKKKVIKNNKFFEFFLIRPGNISMEFSEFT
jgi:hypothetical protein